MYLDDPKVMAYFPCQSDWSQADDRAVDGLQVCGEGLALPGGKLLGGFEPCTLFDAVVGATYRYIKLLMSCLTLYSCFS